MYTKCYIPGLKDQTANGKTFYYVERKFMLPFRNAFTNGSLTSQGDWIYRSSNFDEILILALVGENALLVILSVFPSIDPSFVKMFLPTILHQPPNWNHIASTIKKRRYKVSLFAKIVIVITLCSYFYSYRFASFRSSLAVKARL